MKVEIHGTTILCIQHQGKTVMAGDGQVTLGNTVLKGTARKVRRLFQNKVLAGFAGATSDAFTLFERFEAKLEKHGGDLVRSSVELSKDWRTDRSLRRLEALLIVADPNNQLILSGSGDVIEPDEGCAAIGSGGEYARSAALALKRHNPDMSAEKMVREAMAIAGQICIYTNLEITLESL